MGWPAPESRALTPSPSQQAHAVRDVPSGQLRLEHDIAFSILVALGEADAQAFVRDVARSLQHADFLTALTVTPGGPPTVSAELPVNAAMFGMRSLPFESGLLLTPAGAQLAPRRLAPSGSGWAEVGGEATVVGAGQAESRLDYKFAVAVNLVTPSSEHWGTRALLKMVELTAASVLRRVLERFPRAIEAAANEAVAGVRAPDLH